MRNEFTGYYVRIDGRKSLVYGDYSLSRLKILLDRLSIGQMKTSGDKYSEILIFNKFGYICEDYILLPDGTRGDMDFPFIDDVPENKWKASVRFSYSHKLKQQEERAAGGLENARKRRPQTVNPSRSDKLRKKRFLS